MKSHCRKTGSGDRGGDAVGGGPEGTAIGVWGGGGAGKPSPPSPHQPEAREGPGRLPPAAAGGPGGPPRSLGLFLPAVSWPLPPQTPEPPPTGRTGSLIIILTPSHRVWEETQILLGAHSLTEDSDKSRSVGWPENLAFPTCVAMVRLHASPRESSGQAL